MDISHFQGKSHLGRRRIRMEADGNRPGDRLGLYDVALLGRSTGQENFRAQNRNIVASWCHFVT